MFRVVSGFHTSEAIHAEEGDISKLTVLFREYLRRADSTGQTAWKYVFFEPSGRDHKYMIFIGFRAPFWSVFKLPRP